MATSRNRIIYQSQALFIAPSSTGYHIQTGCVNTGSQAAAQYVGVISTAIATQGVDIYKGSLATGSYDDPYNFNWTGVAQRPPVFGNADFGQAGPGWGHPVPRNPQFPPFGGLLC